MADARRAIDLGTRALSRRSVITRHRIVLGDQVVDYLLIRMAGRRHIHLVIEETELQVRVPYRAGRTDAEHVIRSNAQWVLERLADAVVRERCRLSLQSGTRLPYLDEELTLQVHRVGQLDLFVESNNPRRNVYRVGDRLHVRLDAGPDVSLRTLIECWYRRSARETLSREVNRIGDALGLRPARISIRAQKTCWGSCTSRGSISLNWRLLLIPWRLTEYVLVHELCHLAYLNHSPDFWRMVGEALPDFRHRRALLKEAQYSLVL